MRDKNANALSDSGNDRPLKETQSMKRGSASKKASGKTKKNTQSYEQENVPLIGIGESFTRWLGEGIFSGTVTGAVGALTDILFYLSFIVCYSWGFINTTMFKKGFSDAFKLQMEGLFHFAVLNALICGIIALLLQRSLQLALFELAILASGFLHWKLGAGKYEYFVLCVLIVGMTGRSFKVILAIAFSIGSAMMAAAIVASQMGIITDLVYRGNRHSLGIIYCTDCAAHILFLMIIYVFLRLESMNILEYAALILVLMIMMMTRAKLDIICGIALLAGIPVYRLTRRWHKTKPVRIAASIMSFSYLLFAAGSIIAALRFDKNDIALRRKLHYTLIRRLEISQTALREHPFSLFGSQIEEHGYGGRTKNLPSWDKYFFIDCSYIRLFVIGGFLLFAMILLVMTYAELRSFAYRQYGFLCLLVLVSIACLIEHHLLEYYYNVFPLVAFSGRRLFREDPIPRNW